MLCLSQAPALQLRNRPSPAESNPNVTQSWWRYVKLVDATVCTQLRVTDSSVAAAALTRCVVCATVNHAASAPPTASRCCTVSAAADLRVAPVGTASRPRRCSLPRGTVPSARSTAALIATSVHWPGQTVAPAVTCRSSTSDPARVSLSRPVLQLNFLTTGILMWV